MTADSFKKFIYKNRFLTLALAAVTVAVIVLSIGITRQSGAQGDFITVPIERGSIRNAVSATGTVQAVVTVQVGSQVSGQIQALYADFNSVVKRGELIARIDPRNFEAQVENARANLLASQARVHTVENDLNTQLASLQSAKANLDAARVTRDNAMVIFQRSTELSKTGIVSKTDFDNAKANADSAVAKYNQAGAAVDQVHAQIKATKSQLEQAKAQVDQAKADLDKAQINLGYTKIYSPIDGVVVSRNIDVGQTVAASLQAPTLFVIANDLTKMQVNANIDEADIGKVSDRVDVKFTVDAYPSDSFTGKIAEVRLNPQTVQNVVTYSVIIGVDNSQLKLKPGMTANITITVDERDNALSIPNAALRYTPAGSSGKKETKRLAKQAQRELAPKSERTQEDRSGTPSSQVLSQDKRAQNEVEEARPQGESQQRYRTSEKFGKTRQLANPNPNGRFDKYGLGNSMKNGPSSEVMLAPGQLWNPAEKIKFPTPGGQIARPAIIWVLNEEKKPEPRQVALGITDGVHTEVISGDLKEGEKVIISDASQEAAPSTQMGQSPFGRPFGGGGMKIPKMGKRL